MDQLKVPMHYHPAPLPSPANDPAFLGPEGMFLIFIVICWLWGLWIFLSARGQNEKTAIWVICGPAAWLAALWYAIHRKPKKPILPKEHWEAPSRWN